MRHKPPNGLVKADWMDDTCSLAQARELVEKHHYSRGSANTATFRHGLFSRGDYPLVVSGCALWIPPTRRAAEASTDGDWRRVLALSRLAIDPSVPTNGASFLLSRSIKAIRASGAWDTLVTYADEWQGHTGAIYLATGWDYVGDTAAERTYVVDGRMVARKAGPKTRTHQEMLELGAVMVGSFSKRKFTMRV